MNLRRRLLRLSSISAAALFITFSCFADCNDQTNDDVLCPPEYIHVSTMGGNAIASVDHVYDADKGTILLNNKSSNNDIGATSTLPNTPPPPRKFHTSQQTATAPPPITIVSREESRVGFTVQNTTWFATEAFNDSGESDGDSSTLKPSLHQLLPQHIFVVFAIDEYGSERCIMLENLASSSEMIEAYCSELGSNTAVARVYVRYENIHRVGTTNTT